MFIKKHEVEFCPFCMFYDPVIMLLFVLQALLCSAHVPLYSGLIPPSFHGTVSSLVFMLQNILPDISMTEDSSQLCELCALKDFFKVRYLVHYLL